MLKRAMIIFLLPLLFIFSQQGAITHEISHYGESAPLTQSKDSSKHSSICDKCMSYGELAHALGTSSVHFTTIKQVVIQTFDCFELATHYFFYPYLARAPPTYS